MRCLRDYPRKCDRIHFFDNSINFSEKEFLSLINNETNELSLEQLNKAYIGFLVLRPLPEKIIGRTIFRTYDKNNRDIIFSCTKDYDINLYGLPLKINGSLAFQEQDTVTAACATSALWSAFHKTHNLFDMGHPPSPSEITDFAMEFLYGSRPITSKGLSIHQMCQAIHTIGLEPHVTSLYKKTRTITPILSLIYSYIHGGIPVILVFTTGTGGKHAVTINGYRLEKKPIIDREVDEQSTQDYCRLKGFRISEFYVHDDQIGPFFRMNVINGDSNCPINFESLLTINKTPKSIWGKIKPFAVITPLYKKIRISFLNVYEWITKLDTIIVKSSSLSRNDIEWDIHFSTLKSYKENIRKNYKEYKKQSSKILLEKFPRFIWRCIGNYNGKNIIETTADATDTQKSFFLNNIIFFDTKFKKELKEYLSDTQTNHLSRIVYSGDF